VRRYRSSRTGPDRQATPYACRYAAPSTDRRWHVGSACCRRTPSSAHCRGETRDPRRRSTGRCRPSEACQPSESREYTTCSEEDTRHEGSIESRKRTHMSCGLGRRDSVRSVNRRANQRIGRLASSMRSRPSDKSQDRRRCYTVLALPISMPSFQSPHRGFDASSPLPLSYLVSMLLLLLQFTQWFHLHYPDWLLFSLPLSLLTKFLPSTLPYASPRPIGSSFVDLLLLLPFPSSSSLFFFVSFPASPLFLYVSMFHPLRPDCDPPCLFVHDDDSMAFPPVSASIQVGADSELLGFRPGTVMECRPGNPAPAVRHG